MLWDHQELSIPNEYMVNIYYYSFCAGKVRATAQYSSWWQLDGVVILHAVRHGAKTDLKAASKGEAGIEPNKPKPDFLILTVN